MKTRLLSLLAAAACLICTNINAQAPYRAMYPTQEGKKIAFNHYGADGKLDCTYKMSVRSVKGTPESGGLTMVYNFFDPKGKPIFDGANEFIMKITKADGKTSTVMDEVGKMLKVQNFIQAGDASSMPVDLKVGQTIPDSVLDVKIGKIKATCSTSERKVKDHKTISTPAGSFDAWLVTEKVTTKTPFTTSVQNAETWFVEGYGSVRQTVYDSKGKLVSKSEITSK